MNELLHAMLEDLSGVAVEIIETDPDRSEVDRTVVAIEDLPWNWGAQASISRVVEEFVESRVTGLVLEVGAWGELDLGILRGYPVDDVRRQVGDRVLRLLRLSGAEHGCAVGGGSVRLLGVEDPALLEEAMALWRADPTPPLALPPLFEQSAWPGGLTGSGASSSGTARWRTDVDSPATAFARLGPRRSHVIAERSLAAMRWRRESVAVLAVTADLMSAVCTELRERGTRCIQMRPRTSEPDDRQRYLERGYGRGTVTERLLQSISGPSDWPRTPQGWRDYQLEHLESMSQGVRSGRSQKELLGEVAEVMGSSQFADLSVEQKREVLQQLSIPMAVLEELVPPTLLDELYPGEERRYLRLEDVLSVDELSEPSSAQTRADMVEGLVRRVPDRDLARLLRSTKIGLAVRRDLARQLRATGSRSAEVEKALAERVLAENEADADGPAEYEEGPQLADLDRSSAEQLSGDPQLQSCYRSLAVLEGAREAPEQLIVLLWNRMVSVDRYQASHYLVRMEEMGLVSLTGVPPYQQVHLPDRIDGSLCGTTGEQVIAAHQALLACWRQWRPDGLRRTDGLDPVFNHLPHHLRCAGQSDELPALLLDYGWLRARILANGVGTLLDDFRDVLAEINSSRLSGADGEAEDLRTVQAALRLSARAITTDPGQLAGQLTGRLVGVRSTAVARLRDGIATEETGSWIRPLDSGISPPDRPLKMTMRGHREAVNDVALTPDGRQVLSASSDHTVKVWDLETGVLVRTLRGHSSDVHGVAVSSSGRWAVSVAGNASSPDGDPSLRTWDLESGATLGTSTDAPDCLTCVALSPDDRTIIAGTGSHDPFRPSRASVVLMDAPTLRPLPSLSGHTEVVNAVTFTRDGRTAVSGAGRSLHLGEGADPELVEILKRLMPGVPSSASLVDTAPDCTVRSWDPSSGRQLQVMGGQTEPVRGLAALPDPQQVVSCGTGSALHIWDVVTGTEVATINTQPESGRTWCLAVTPDGTRCIGGSDTGRIQVLDLRRREALAAMRRHSGGVNALAVSQDGQVLVSGGADACLRVWDLAALERQSAVDDRSGITTITPVGDGDTVVTSHAHGGIWVWNAPVPREAREIPDLRDAQTVVIEPEAAIAVAAFPDGTMTLLDVTTGQPVAPRLPQGQRDGIRLLAAGAGCAVHLRVSGRVVSQPLNGQTQRQQWWCRRSADLTTMAVSADGRFVIAGGQRERLVVWALSSGAKVASLRARTRTGPAADFIRQILLAKDGTRAATFSSLGQLRVFDLPAWVERQRISLGATPAAVALSRDGRWAVSSLLLTMSEDGLKEVDRTLTLWDLERGRQVCQLWGSDHGSTQIAFLPDGRHVVALLDSSVITVWDDSGERVARLDLDVTVESGIAVRDDGTLVLGDSEGGIHTFRFVPGAFPRPVEQEPDEPDAVGHDSAASAAQRPSALRGRSHSARFSWVTCPGCGQVQALERHPSAARVALLVVLTTLTLRLAMASPWWWILCLPVIVILVGALLSLPIRRRRHCLACRTQILVPSRRSPARPEHP